MATECHVILCGIPHNIMDTKGKKRICHPFYLLLFLEGRFFIAFLLHILMSKKTVKISKNRKIFLFF